MGGAVREPVREIGEGDLDGCEPRLLSQSSRCLGVL